jgi:hypothetical protein
VDVAAVTLHIGPPHGTDEWHDARRGIVTASTVGRLITQRHLTAIDYGCPECLADAAAPCLSLVKRSDGEPPAPIKSLHAARTAEAADRRDDTPPVLEVADNDDSRALTATLVAERITGWTEPAYINADMWRGIEDEPRAIEAYSEQHAPVHAHGDEARLLVQDCWGFQIGASPDGLVGDEGVVEVKSRKPRKQIQTFLTDEVPPENMAQLQTHLLVADRAWCDYVSYAGGMPLYDKRALPDPGWHGVIVAAIAHFETPAAAMVAAHTRATKGQPLTERVVEPEMSL